MVKLFANSGDPDQTPHSAASDLGLHCFPFTRLGVSRLQWANIVLVFLNICFVCTQIFIFGGTDAHNYSLSFFPMSLYRIYT